MSRWICELCNEREATVTVGELPNRYCAECDAILELGRERGGAMSDACQKCGLKGGQVLTYTSENGLFSHSRWCCPKCLDDLDRESHDRDMAIRPAARTMQDWAIFLLGGASHMARVEEMALYFIQAGRRMESEKRP